MKKILQSKRGEGYIDVLVAILVILLVLALIINVVPVLIAKQQLNTFANEIVREAEISGQIGSEVNARICELEAQTTIRPAVEWDTTYVRGTRKIQLDTPITVTVRATFRIGGFGGITSFEVPLMSKATGRSECYWK